MTKAGYGRETLSEVKSVQTTKDKHKDDRHLHWVAACNVDDCGKKFFIGSPANMMEEQAQQHVDQANLEVNKAKGTEGVSYYRLELDVV